MNDPLVLIAGTACDARLFDHQLRFFSLTRPVTILLPTQGDRIEQVVADVLVHLPHRFALAGHSLGGAVAMEILRHAPERVSRLALISCSPLTDTPAQAAGREPQIVRLRAGKLDEALAEMMPPDALAPGAGRIAATQLFQSMGAALGTSVIERQVRALQRRRDQQATLRKVNVPSLVLCGDADGLLPIKRHEFLAELIPQCSLDVIADAGHLPSIEQPQAVTDALCRWLDQPYVLR